MFAVAVFGLATERVTAVVGETVALAGQAVAYPAADVDPALPAQISPPEDAEELTAIPHELLLSTDTAARRAGAQRLIASIEERWPDDHRRRFLVALAPMALQSAIEHCVPPSVTVGQAILESGWGRSGLAKRHNNLFGVKGRGVTLETAEYEEGARLIRRARFARFDDWGESLAHHGELLSEDPRYAEARPHWKNWRSFLATVAPTYATDPRYVRRVARLVERYRLDEWDGLIVAAARKEGGCGLDDPHEFDTRRAAQ